MSDQEELLMGQPSKWVLDYVKEKDARILWSGTMPEVGSPKPWTVHLISKPKGKDELLLDFGRRDGFAVFVPKLLKD